MVLLGHIQTPKRGCYTGEQANLVVRDNLSRLFLDSQIELRCVSYEDAWERVGNRVVMAVASWHENVILTRISHLVKKFRTEVDFQTAIRLVYVRC